MRYDMLSLGPARMDIFVKLPDEAVEEECSIDRKRCVIELGFGEKIPVNSVTYAVGGNTGNNAVGLSRLGFKVAMAGTMGDGWTDKQALEILKSERVEVSHMNIAPGKMGLGVVLNYAEERTILSYYPPAEDTFPGDADLSAEWMYFTTAGENYQEFYSQALAAAEKWGAKIAFNPGSRQIRDGEEKLKPVLEKTEILFVNREEGQLLVPDQSITNIKGVLAALLSLGPKMVVVTDGPEGTYVFDGGRYLYMPILPVEVAERTGAGDAFGSGFLAAYMSGRSLEEALKWGTVNSASVLGFVGPQAGLLTPEKMTEWLKKTEDIPVREV
jgi:sugar/nucleoside kinase (ribokinase family)